MLQENYDDIISEDDDNDDISGSEVEYPLIDLKTGLANDLRERRMKDIEKVTNQGRWRLNVRNTEFSREVIGHNKMTQYQMSKTVNYFFSEFDYIREKIKRSQQQTLKQLQEIHLDKRRQIRESYKYHNEEMRYDIQRIKEEEKFILEQTRLEEMMRRRERSIARLSVERKVLMKEMNAKDSEKVTKKVRKVLKEIDNQKEAENEDITVAQIIPSKSHSFLHAGAVEVTKDNNNPRTVKRSIKYVNDEENMPQLHSDMVQVTNDIEEIATVNETNEIKEDNKNEVLTVTEDNENNNPIVVIPKIKTAKEIMKERQRIKQRKLKEILNLPYNIYRRNSKGKLQKVDHQTSKHEFKEPSNKEKYKMRKLLGEEKEKYQSSISKLTKTTEMIIQEDIKITRQLNAPQQKIIKEIVSTSQSDMIPKDWMGRFVSSNIPVDIDPSSTEALLFCRHIRVPLHKFSHLPNYKLYYSPL